MARRSRTNKDRTVEDFDSTSWQSTTAGDEFENFETHSRFSIRGLFDVARSIERQAEDAVISLVPEEVTRHLVNSQKEAVKAFMRLGEIAIERLDERARRAHDIHESRRGHSPQSTHETRPPQGEPIVTETTPTAP